MASALRQLASSSRPLWALGPRVGPSLPGTAPWPIFVVVTVRVLIVGHSLAFSRIADTVQVESDYIGHGLPFRTLTFVYRIK
jgi:hypothetical protein